MSTLATRSHATIVTSIAQGMQGRISRFLNFAIGSMLRVVAESYAGQALWLQFNALQIQMQSRLATSYGPDVDSFVQDWPCGVTRFGATAGTTLCTFGRRTAGASPVYVPVGGQCKTADGTQVFQVYADPTNGAYVASYQPLGATAPTGGYVMPAQVGSVLVPVQAVTPGSAGNVAAGSISLLSSQMPGVDTVTNPAAVTNAADQESDASVKQRFALAVEGRSGGTTVSIQSAIANIKLGMTSVVLSGQNIDRSSNPGTVSVIVDDGSGAISSTLLAAAQTAVTDNGVGARAAGIQAYAYAAVTAPIAIVMQITSLSGYVHQTVVAQVTAAIGLFVNGLGQNQTVSYFRVGAIAERVPGVGEIVPGTYTLNGGTADVPASPQTTPKLASAVVS